jgi:small redox-active disulfide protein 2
MRIEVLGPGCKNCEILYENVLKALDQAGLRDKIEVVKIKDIDYFMKKGVLATPGLIFDDQVISTGRLLTPEQVLERLRAKGLTGDQE